MRKLILLLFTGILLFSCTAVGADEGRILRFIYCSDVHYGLEREFRGKEVGSDEVSRAMLATFKLLSETRLPEDSGVGAGIKFGSPDFVVCTGDMPIGWKKEFNLLLHHGVNFAVIGIHR